MQNSGINLMTSTILAFPDSLFQALIRGGIPLIAGFYHRYPAGTDPIGGDWVTLEYILLQSPF